MKRKSAIVTGASRGIGRGIAIELGRAGYHGAINFSGNLKAAKQALDLVTEVGGAGIIIQADVSSAENREQPVAEDYLPFSTGEVINDDGGFHLHRL